MESSSEVRRKKILEMELALEAHREKKDIVGKPIHWQQKKLDAETEKQLMMSLLLEPDELPDEDNPKNTRCVFFSVSQLQLIITLVRRKPSTLLH